MAQETLGFAGFGLRLAAAVVLVLLTYNPSGWSYAHWATHGFADNMPVVTLAGIALLIGWVVFLRATMRSLGLIGLVLALAFFGALLWVVIDRGWLDPANGTALQWIAVAIVALVLATGMSWSHVRRRMSGQADVDEVDAR